MPSEEDLERQLKEQAEAIIKQVLANKKPAGENSLEDLERLALQAGQGFEEQVLQALAGAESQAEEEPVCEACRQRMQSRGKRKRQLVTQAGEARLERRYYVCPRCGKTIFPPG